MDIILILAAGAAAYLLWPRKKAESAQDLIGFKEIHPDGVIELPGYQFRLVMEVEPVNLALRSREEQAAIWLGLRSMANSFSIPHTFLVQTRYLNLRDYLDRYRRSGADYGENIGGYASRLSDWLESESEGKQQRSRRVFLILKIDAASAGIESGVQTDNPLVNSALRTIGRIGQAKLPPGEMRRLARDELLEAASVAHGVLSGLEIRSVILDKRGVLEMLYQTFNRDMASGARLVEADRDEAFSLFVRSETPEIVERGLRDARKTA